MCCVARRGEARRDKTTLCCIRVLSLVLTSAILFKVTAEAAHFATNENIENIAWHASTITLPAYDYVLITMPGLYCTNA